MKKKSKVTKLGWVIIFSLSILAVISLLEVTIFPRTKYSKLTHDRLDTPISNIVADRVLARNFDNWFYYGRLNIATGVSCMQLQRTYHIRIFILRVLLLADKGESIKTNEFLAKNCS